MPTFYYSFYLIFSGRVQQSNVLLVTTLTDSKSFGAGRNYSPPHWDAFLLLSQQLTPISSRCRVESKCRRDVSRGPVATPLWSFLLERYWSEAEHLSNGLGSGI